jgi:thioredoxin-like negative regulator of GroEL
LTLAANATPPPPTANLTITPSNTTLALTPHTTTQSQNPASSPVPPSSTLPATQPQTVNSKPETSSPSDPLLAAAQTAAAAGNFTDAIRDYWKALAKDDSNPDTWLALGQAYLANKQYPDAASVAQEAIRRAPDNAAYTVFSLQVEKVSQPSARYQTDLSAAYQKFPDDADLALTLSDAFHQQGDTRDASLVLTNYLGLAPATDPRRNDVQDALDNISASAKH